MANLAPCPFMQFLDNNGDPLSGGKIYTYLAGTTTPVSTYTDSTGGVSNANPVILDSSGRADIWLGDGSYKFILKDSADVLIKSVDNISASASGGSVQDAWVSHVVTDGQAATNLTGETVNSASYVSALYEYAISRGTTVFSAGKFALVYRNSAWEVVTQGDSHADAASDNGVTFSLSGTTTAQLKAALDTGAGDGTINLKRSLVPA